MTRPDVRQPGWPVACTVPSTNCHAVPMGCRGARVAEGGRAAQPRTTAATFSHLQRDDRREARRCSRTVHKALGEEALRARAEEVRRRRDGALRLAHEILRRGDGAAFRRQSRK